MPEPTPPQRRLPGRQQEARTNDSAVLAAAREVFATQGEDASMAEIARRAGVGVGSIYRRYPTKRALGEALRVQAVSGAAARAHEVAASGQPARLLPRSFQPQGTGGVHTFLALQITHASGPPLLPPGGDSPLPEALTDVSAELHTSLGQLVARDLAAGLVPTGFTPADVMQLLLHLRPALPFARVDADAVHLRYLELAMRGLRAQAEAGEPLTPGPEWAAWISSWRG